MRGELLLTLQCTVRRVETSLTNVLFMTTGVFTKSEEVDSESCISGQTRLLYQCVTSDCLSTACRSYLYSDRTAGGEASLFC